MHVATFLQKDCIYIFDGEMNVSNVKLISLFLFFMSVSAFPELMKGVFAFDVSGT